MSLENPAIPVQEAWKVPALLNNWANFGGNFNAVGYWKDSFGVVHLRGLVKSGTPESVIFTLPVGYRPPSYEVFATTGSTAMGAQMARVDVQTDGSVVAKGFLSTNGTATFLSVDGITFRSA